MTAKECVVGALCLVGLARADVAASGDATGGAEIASNLRLIGTNDLQTRGAYQPVIHDQNGRRLLYVGHHPGRARNAHTDNVEANGTSVVDVTDPRRPVYAAHIPVTPSDWPADANDFVKTGAQHVQVCDGAMLPKGRKNRVYMLRNQGNLANEIVDVTDPAKARVVAQVARVGRSSIERVPYRTHKNWWECSTGIAYLPSSLDGWSSIRVLRVFDLSDPERPRHVRDFGLVGTQPGAGGTESGGEEGVHEATVYGNRISLTYGAFNHGVIQILDRDKLLNADPKAADRFEPTPDNLRYPVIAQLEMPNFWGAHSAKPVLGVRIPDYVNDAKGAMRDFLVVTSEGITFPCNTVRHLTFMVDITDERHPFPVANFQVPAHAQAMDFCRRGTFGPHAPNASHVFGDRVMALSYFSAGTRLVDIRDPFKPVEIGFFIPKTTASTVLALPSGSTVKNAEPVPITNNVEIDDRGFLYSVDRAGTGLHILEITGAAASIAGKP